MPIATGLAIGLGAASIGGSLAGSAIASRGAGKAADTQTAAANQAALLQKQASDASLAEQKRQFGIQQDNIAPWLSAGKDALSRLQSLSGFQAPTGADAQNDPGYQFRLQEGTKALERSAAAKGGLLTGGTAKALQQFGQDYASTEYQNVYNRKFGEYNSTYDKLAGLAGIGRDATAQANASSSTDAAGVTNILMNGANQQGGFLQNAAAARGSGYAAGGNIWGGALSNAGQMPFNLYALKQLSMRNA